MYLLNSEIGNESGTQTYIFCGCVPKFTASAENL